MLITFQSLTLPLLYVIGETVSYTLEGNQFGCRGVGMGYLTLKQEEKSRGEERKLFKRERLKKEVFLLSFPFSCLFVGFLINSSTITKENQMTQLQELGFVVCVWGGLITEFCTICPKGMRGERKRGSKACKHEGKEKKGSVGRFVPTTRNSLLKSVSVKEGRPISHVRVQYIIHWTHNVVTG